MNISKDTVVQFHYDLVDVGTGEQVESSREHDPIAYLHGHGNMLVGVEDALTGKAAGDEFSITLEAKDAYGERQEDAIQRIPLKHLSGAKVWKKGMVATVHTDHGVRQVTVVKVGHFNADCDINHPLAGKTLTFNISVVDVRAATEEELAHGHAHGVGGHHHD